MSIRSFWWNPLNTNCVCVVFLQENKARTWRGHFPNDYCLKTHSSDLCARIGSDFLTVKLWKIVAVVVAQLVVRLLTTPEVRGLNPVIGKYFILHVQIHSKTCPSKRCVEKIKIKKNRPVWAHFLLENCGKLFLLYSIRRLNGRRICYLDRKTIQAIARAIADAKRFKILSLSKWKNVFLENSKTFVSIQVNLKF